MRRSLFALCLAAVAGLSGASAQAQNCQPVQFLPGSYSAQITDFVIPVQSNCYSLSVRPGQTAQIRITNGDGAFFTTNQTGGGLTQFASFVLGQPQLLVYVHTSAQRGMHFGIEFAVY